MGLHHRNMMLQLCILTVLILAHIGPANGLNWNTYYDQPFSFECPDTQILTDIASTFESVYGDRRWNFGCSPLFRSTAVSVTDCKWSDLLNDYTDLIEFQCEGEKVITGLSSVHLDQVEDREWKIKCCTLGDLVPHACEYRLANYFGGHINFHVPYGYALKGVNSVYNRTQEDRSWSYDMCKLDRIL